MTIAPERVGAGGPVINASPIRYPDTSDGRAMATRGWWLVLLNFFIPGSAQAVAGNRRLGKLGLGATLILWMIGILLILGLVLWRSGTLALLLTPWALYPAAVLIAAYGVLWVILSLDTLRLTRAARIAAPHRFFVPILALLLALLQGFTAAYAAPRVFAAAGTFGSIFHSSAAVVPPSDGYYNVLLLGADSGDDRDSVRFDSISVVSINADSGDITVTGIPRDLAHVPFSEDSPMRAEYPNYFSGVADPECGWNSGINQLTNAVEFCREDGGAGLYPDARSNGSTPAIEATKDAAEGLLGIDVPYYVAIDMHGFAALIDALGGVDISVEERLPEGGGPAYDGQPAEEWASGWIEVGEQHMSGETALWYARSRYTTSDWDRMERQRELQDAILTQMNPQNVLQRFEEVARAGEDVVSTDVPRALVSTFVELAAGNDGMTSIELSPDNGVDQDQPDVERIRQMIRHTLHPDGTE